MESFDGPSRENQLLAETSQDGCATVTCDAFADGLDYAGLFIQIVGSSVFAIALVIALYVYQNQRKKKNQRLDKGNW